MRVNVWAEDWEVPGDETSVVSPHAPRSGIQMAGTGRRDDEPTAVVPVGSGAASAEESPQPSGRYQARDPEHGCTRVTGLSRISVAPDAPRRPDRDEDGPAQQRANEHFRTAELLLERGFVRDAVLEAQKAMRLCPPRPEQEALYAWLLAARSGPNGAVPRCVWERLENALAADPACERAHAYVALLRSRR